MKWETSKLRFYILNALWNYKFWLFSEKKFKKHTYEINAEKFNLDNLDETGKMLYKKIKVSKRRFLGYMYNGLLHLDNPGFKHTVNKETWMSWKNKGLIK